MEMFFRLNPVALSLALPALISGGLAIYAFTRRQVVGSRTFAGLMLALCAWSVFYGVELGCLTLDGMLICAAFEYLGIATLPVLVLILVLLFTGREKSLTGRNITLLFVIPCITIAMVATNQWHHLYYSTAAVDTRGPFPMLALTRGPWFWVHTAYSYTMLLATTILLIKQVGKLGSHFRTQVAAMLAGMSVPWAVSILYVGFGAVLFGELDPTPFAFSVTGMVMAWSMFRHGLFDILPVAYDKIADSMDDAIIVMDQRNRIVVYNRSAHSILGLSAANIGKPASGPWKDHPELINLAGSGETARFEIELGQDNSKRHYEVSAYNLADRHKHVMGKVILLHDTTDRKQAEEALKESEDNFRTFFDSVGDMVIIGSPDGRILHTNPAMSHKLGYSPQELRDMHVLDVHPPEKRAEAEEIFAAMFKGERDTCPLPLQHKDGTRVPVETRIWIGKWSGRDCIYGLCKDLTREQEALQKFDRLFAGNPTPMAVSNLNGKEFTDVNDAWLKTLGYSRDEVIGKTTADLGIFVQPEKAAEIAERLERYGRVANVELKAKCKSGALLDGIFSGEIIESQGEKYLLTVMVDQTERKRAEEARKNSEDQYRILFNSSSEGIGIVQNGMFKLVNTKLVHLLGLTEGEVLSTPVTEFVHPEDRDMVMERYMRRVTGETFESVYQFRSIDRTGEVKWVEISTVLIEWEGSPATLDYYSDVTDFKKAEEALRQSEEKFRLLIENSHDIIYTLNPQGVFTFVSPSWTTLLGQQVNQVVGQPFPLFVHPDDLAECLSFMQSVMETGKRQEGIEYRVQHANGTWYWHTSSAVPLRDQAGAIVGFEGIARDITERKQMLQKLEDMATHDYLTGLPNRLLLLDRFGVVAALAQRNRVRLAVMSLDLDGFKSINDTLGHNTGDEVLRAVSNRLRGVIRASDTLARVGGDEFILLMMETGDMKDLSATAQKILDSFAEQFSTGGHQLSLSTSIGIAIYPEDAEDMETLIQKSDAALYYSKGHGRNQFKFFSDGDVLISGDHKSAH